MGPQNWSACALTCKELELNLLRHGRLRVAYVGWCFTELSPLEWDNVMRFGKPLTFRGIYHEGSMFKAAPGSILLEDMFL